MRFGRKREPEPPAEAYTRLREQILGLTAEQLNDAYADAPLLALAMDMGYPEGAATLIGVVDGASSLYFSNGGGIIGAGEHATVAEANRRLLEAGRGLLHELAAISSAPLPEEGMTQFVAVTPGGLRGASAPEQELGGGGHALSPLFYAAQDVITQIRLLPEANQRG